MIYTAADTPRGWIVTSKIIPISPLHVDRDEELRLFRSFLKDEATRHVLLIQADAGMGKSALMEQFYSEAAAFPRALVDLRPQAFTSLEVLGELASGLETTTLDLAHAAQPLVSFFPQYTEQRAQLAEAGHTDIQHARLSDNIQTAKSPVLRAEQAARQIITDLFFHDLDAIIQNYGKVVLIIDTFEKASIDVKQWVTGLFLNRIRGRLGVIAVLAGRTIPGYWEFATTCQLMPLELSYVQEYVTRAELSLSEEEVRVLYDVTDGIPLYVKTYVAKLKIKRAGSRS